MPVSRIVTGRNGINVIQFMTIKAPIINEALRQLSDMRLHLGQGRAEHRQMTVIAGRPNYPHSG